MSRKAVLLTLLLSPSAAAPAAAQLRVGIAVAVEGSSVRPQVPVVGMGVINGLPTSLPLNTTLSLSPSLSAPSALPSISALSPVELNAAKTPLPALETSKTSGLTPSATPIALAVPVFSAASKADDARAEAAKAVADWKSARSAAGGASGPAPVELSAKLDALFDGSMPTASVVLGRAESLGLSEGALGLAISESKTAAEAAARLSALGVLGAKEAALARSEEDEFRFLLTRVWRAAAPQIPASYKIDESFPVAALKVERDGTTYFVHAVAHGQTAPPRRGAVLSLARQVLAAGHALYSEQNLPAYYGYKAGLETLDHKAPDGYPTTIVVAAPQYTRATLALKRAIDWLVSPGTALAAAAWALVQPASPWAWLALAAASLLAFVTLTGGLPLLRLRRRRRAAEARAAGLADMAEQYADEARNFFVSKPDLEVLRGLELPQPLGGSATDAYSVRSRAIADAVAADAASSGAKTAHLIVGHLHAHEVAWRLANPPERRS